MNTEARKDIALLFSDGCDKAGILQMLSKALESYKNMSLDDSIECYKEDEFIVIKVNNVERNRYHTYKDFGFEDDNGIVGFIPVISDEVHFRFLSNAVTEFKYINSHFISRDKHGEYTLEIKFKISKKIYVYDDITDEELRQLIEKED